MKRAFAIGLVVVFASVGAPGQVYFLDEIPPPAQPVQPSQRKLTGTVTDLSGAPLAGVEVALQPMAFRPVLSDASGKFEFNSPASARGSSPGQFSLLARATNKNLALIQAIDIEATNIDLRLKEGVTIGIKLENADGKPITNGLARITLVTRERGVSLSAQGAADAHGQIEVAALPTGHHYRLAVTAGGYGPTNLDAEADQTAGARFDFPVVILPKADRQLAGQVLDASGQPIKGALVSLSGMGQPVMGQPVESVRTDEQGRFRLNQVPPGRVQLTARMTNSGIGFSAMAGDTNVVIRSAPAVARSPYVTNEITGMVSGPSGEPAGRVTVSLVPPQSSPMQTDSSGRYRISLLAPTGHRQTISIMASDAARNLAAISPIDDSATNVDLKLAAGLTLAVRVLDSQGKALASAQGSVSVYSGNSVLPLGDVSLTNANGLIEAKGLPASQRYRLNVRAAGFGIANAIAEPGETAGPRFELPPLTLLSADKKLAGQVVDADGQPVSGATVNLQGTNQPSLTARADSKGRFQFDQVVAGPVRVSVGGIYRVGPGQPEATEAMGGDTNVIVLFANPQSGPASALRRGVRTQAP